MSSKQTRRSISISGPTYNRIKKHCGKEGISMSVLTEALLLGHLEPKKALDTESPTQIVAIELTAAERSILKILQEGRKPLTLKDIELADGLSYLQAKNAVRRPRTLGLIDNTQPGTFKLTAKGKKVATQVKK